MRTALIILIFYSISITIFLIVNHKDAPSIQTPTKPKANSTISIKKTIDFFKEDTIKVGWTDTEVFRLFWLPSFHDPIMVKINRKQDSVWVTTKRIQLINEEHHIEEKTHKISNEVFIELKKKLKAAYYWHLPNFIPENGLDGAKWMTEAYINGKYKQVILWSPPDGSTKDIGLYLFQMAHINEKIY